MSRSRNLNTGAALGAAAVVGLMAGAQSAAASPRGPVPHPLSVVTARYLHGHPAARAELFAQLPRSPAGAAVPTVGRVTPPAGGTWQAVTTAPVDGLCNPLLLTDGTVMMASCNTPVWYKLTPDSSGNYVDGTWSVLASLPIIRGTQYAPQYHASAVLPDGRVIIMGGEYNGSNTEVWTNQGAIYDPIADQWTAVNPPAGDGWAEIGDAQGVVLADGTFMLGACCSQPTANALFDPQTLGWTATGGPSAGANYQDEQGYELLPSKNVLTVDIWTNYFSNGDATNAEQYTASSGTWSSAGNTPVPLADPFVCGSFEIGPAVLRGDGTLVAFGGNTGCRQAASPADPTAIYNAKKGTWKAGPNVPATCGSGGKTSCDLADAPAALLPNGNILFAASAGFGGKPTHFFEYSAKNAIQQVADPLFNAHASGAYYYNLMVLPNGQILMTDFSNTAEIYSGTGSPVATWAPAITKVPATLKAGKSYVVRGKQLNGRSQGGYYGDDVQMSTNYPIVRITNTASGHVVYARTSNHSTMSVTPNAAGSTHFAVPHTIEKGASSVSVIANGIASAPVSVTVN